MKKIILIILALGVLGFIALRSSSQMAPESVPQGCTMEAKLCPDGSSVGRTGPNCEFEACPQKISTPPNPIQPSQGKCYVGGCSGQICSDKEGAVSDCSYREEYACYQSATCERQTNGSCGWTQTAELKACIISADKSGDIY